jgi:O-antigen/teichoic acid export membrane protein
VLAKALGPQEFGVWITLLLIVTYSPIISLGSVETLVKKVPYFLGRNEKERVREVESSVLGSLTLSAGVILALALAALLVLPLTAIKISRYIVAMWLVTIAISYFSAYFYQRFCAYENFKMTGATDACRSVLSLLLVGGLGWVWGLRGAVAGFFLQEIGVFGIAASLNIRAYGAPGISFRKDLIVNAVRIGFPITLLLWVLGLSASVDRVVLGSLLGAVSVGYYGLGMSVAGILALIPMVVGRVLYPKVNKQFGENPDSESMKRVVVAPSLALGTLAVNMQAVLLVGAPFLYCVMLPKYRPGLLAGQILILGSFFGALMRNGTNYLIATNHERIFLKYIAATLVFNIVFDVGLVRAGFGTEGVAVGTSLAGLFLTTLVWRRTLKGLGFAGRRQWGAMFELFLPIIVLTLVFCCLWVFHRTMFQKPGLSLAPIGVLLLVLVNGILWCIPVYRNEMIAWKNRVLRRNKAAPARNLVEAPEFQPADKLEK